MFGGIKSYEMSKTEKLNELEERKCNLQLLKIDQEELAFQKNYLSKIKKHMSKYENVLNDSVASHNINHEYSTISEYSRTHSEDSYSKKIEENIKELLISNDEVDVEKVLCLHLLAIKQAEGCKLKGEGTNRHINVFTRYANLLPNYIIETDESKIKCSCWDRKVKKMKNDHRPIKMHLTINKQIEKIINIVIITLKELNGKKLKMMISMAHNINILRSILVKPQNQKFLTELLKSKLVLNSLDNETEICTLMRGSNEMIRDVNRYKKNLVFRFNPPNSLVYLQALLYDCDKDSNCSEYKRKDSFCSLLDICRKISVGEDINLATTGLSILRNNSTSSGMAVISEDGSDITYVSGPNYKKSKSPGMFVNNLTLLLKSSGLMDQAVKVIPSSQDEIDDKATNHYTKTINKKIKELEDLAKKYMDFPAFEPKQVKEKKMINDGDVIKSKILSRLTNQQRIMVANEAARLKSKSKVGDNIPASPAALGKILSNVMSKRSLLNIARISTKEEREYFLKPLKNGGLGLGEVIIGTNNMAKMEKLAAIAQGETMITMITPLGDQIAPVKESLIDVPTDSSWDMLKIKHDISQCEISKKFKKFLCSPEENNKVVCNKPLLKR